MKPTQEIVDRMWSRVVATEDGCLEYGRSRSKSGYGQIHFGSTGVIYTHRLAWIATYGEIPPGMFVCHRCDNPPCVNPTHLFIGSCADNLRDMAEKGRSKKGRKDQSPKTHCKRGHLFTEADTYVDARGWRHCRACDRVRWAEKHGIPQ